MELSKESFQALEDIVGPDNISDDPAILDSYAFQYEAELEQDGSKFMHRPVAVVLPGSTEEVQSIVRACNRYKLKCKAYSTGWGAPGVPKKEGVIQLDMRRMDRILEIDEQNMFAVVEPYVIGSTLQAEAMKRGLNTHIVGAGCNCSVLASATSLGGSGADSIFLGFSGENLLALEWVMPTGEILRTGSLGSGCGWFCGEGPGPSLRALVRGMRGAAGSFGVFTKCALKLSPWPGPSEMPVEGIIPCYNTPLPDNFKAYTLAFPNWKAYADAYYKLYDSQIGYVAHRQFNLWGEEIGPAFLAMFTDPDKTIDDMEQLLGDPQIQKFTEEMKRSFQLVLAGMTPRDIEYQEEALEQILAETGGNKVARMAEPDMQKFTMMYLLKMCFKHLNFALSGSFESSFSQYVSPDFVMSSVIPVAEEVLGKHLKSGLIVDSGPDTMMAAVSSMGGGGSCGLEQFVHYDPHEIDSVREVVDFLKDALAASSAQGWPPGLEARILKVGASFPRMEIHDWLRKVRDAFDPNDIGDGSYV